MRGFAVRVHSNKELDKTLPKYELVHITDGPEFSVDRC
jgi:hypothetical protein